MIPVRTRVDHDVICDELISVWYWGLLGYGRGWQEWCGGIEGAMKALVIKLKLLLVLGYM